MAGPGIRAWNLATQLAAEHEVRLVTTASASMQHPRLPWSRSTTGAPRRDDWCDIFLAQGWLLAGRRFLTASDKIVVVDLYDRCISSSSSRVTRPVTTRADGLRSSTRHRAERADAPGRPVPLRECEEAARLLVGPTRSPRGASTLRPTTPTNRSTSSSSWCPSCARVTTGTTERRVKGVISGIDHGDVSCCGAAGSTTVRPPDVAPRRRQSANACAQRASAVHGAAPSEPGDPRDANGRPDEALADELGLTACMCSSTRRGCRTTSGKGVLLDADVGVSTHLHHIETEFSYRTRILDYLGRGSRRGDTGDALAALSSTRTRADGAARRCRCARRRARALDPR